MDRKKIINIYIIVITVLTVLAMIYGVYRIFKIGSPLLSLGKSKNVSESVDVESFEKMELDMSVCEVELKPGDDYHVSYDLEGLNTTEYIPQIDVKDGALTIVQKKAKNASLLNSLRSCVVTITVPKDAKLTSIKMTTDVGDLNIKDIKCDDINIISHVGDIDVVDATVDLLTIKADVGDIDINSGKYDTISVTSNVGDVKVKDSICNTVTADSNIGDVSVDNVLDESGNKPNMDVNVDIGDKNINDK